MRATQLNTSQTITMIETMMPGTTNSCRMNPALGGSTGGKASPADKGWLLRGFSDMMDWAERRQGGRDRPRKSLFLQAEFLPQSGKVL